MAVTQQTTAKAEIEPANPTQAVEKCYQCHATEHQRSMLVTDWQNDGQKTCLQCVSGDSTPR